MTIAGRYNGPPTTGNGGYSCGIIAKHIDGAAKARLNVPPPLKKPLALEKADDGTLSLMDGNELVGFAVPSTLELEVPAPPSLEQARAAQAFYMSADDQIFATCFVCGLGREHDDGLCLQTGTVTQNNYQMLASSWLPPQDLLDDKGNVIPEIVWSALDCPGFFAACGEQLKHAVLGELHGHILADVPGKEPLVVYSWPMGVDGRKLYAGVAIANQEGQVLAKAKTTWIVLKDSAA